MTLPTLKVLLDNGTGSFPFDITSKVLALDGYDISRGRGDWIGAVTAGELNIMLNNSDGRFTPGSTILASPSPITVDQRIRVQEGFGGGVGFGLGGFGLGGFGGAAGGNRFTGYVKSWPVTWPAVVTTFSTVQLTATDAQARAERRTLRSMLEEESLRLSPTAYYTLSEEEGSTAAGDTSGNDATSLVVTGSGMPVVFGNGTGPSADGLTAVQFASGQYLTATSPSIPTSTARSVGFWFNTTQVPGGLGVPMLYHYGFALTLDPTGHLVANVLLGGSVITTDQVNDGHTHFAAITSDGVNFTLYLDGAAIGSGAVGAGVPANEFSVGAFSGFGFTGTVSHVAVWPTLSAADVALIYGAGAGFAETGTARLMRLASYAGLSVGTLDPSLTDVPVQATSGRSAQDAIQEVADAEGGLVFIDGSGNLTFHNRARAAAKPTPDLTLSSQYVTPDVVPVTDDQQIVNYVEATAAGTGAVSLVRDTTSETTHGRYPVSQTYLVQTDAEALDRAAWVVGKFAEPFPRYGTLSINLYKMTDTQAAATIQALDLNCWLRVTSMASQNPGGTVADVVIQGWRAEVTAEGWTITCNVVSRSLFVTLIIDDPVYGAIDSYPIGF